MTIRGEVVEVLTSPLLITHLTKNDYRQFNAYSGIPVVSE